MTTSGFALLALVFAYATPCVRAQQPDWDTSGAKEVDSNIRNLPAQDQQGIERSLAEDPQNLRAIRVDTPSGHMFLVQGSGNMMCGATGNCSSWVLSSDYKILMKTISEAIKVQPASHHGLPDLLTEMNGSAFSGDLKNWRFDGMKYHHIACASYDYADANGNELKHPLITPQPCSPR